MIISPVTCSIDDYDDILFAAIPTSKEFLDQLEKHQEAVMRFCRTGEGQDCSAVEFGGMEVFWLAPGADLEGEVEYWENLNEYGEWITVPDSFVVPESIIRQVDCPRLTMHKDGGFCFKAYDPNHCKYALETYSFSASDVVRFRKESVGA